MINKVFIPKIFKSLKTAYMSKENEMMLLNFDTETIEETELILIELIKMREELTTRLLVDIEKYEERNSEKTN